MTWECHVDDPANVIYDIILGICLLTLLGLNLKISKNAIELVDVYFKVSTSPMIDLGIYAFKDLNTGKITPEEYVTSNYVDELYSS